MIPLSLNGIVIFLKRADPCDIQLSLARQYFTEQK